MKSRITNWLKRHRALRAVIPSAMLALILCAMFVPAYAQLEYLDVDGTYAVNARIGTQYLDGARHPLMNFDTLTLDNTSGAVTGTLTTFGKDITLSGLLGPGGSPTIALTGTDSVGTNVTMNGRVKTNVLGEVTSISGRIQGYVTSDGEKWEDSADGTAAYSTVKANSGAYSALLTAGTLANPEAIILHKPANRIRLSQLDTLAAGKLGFYYYASQATNGPQMMLRFVPAGNDTMTYYHGATAGHVDITIMPLQSGAAVNTWTQYAVTKDSAICGYYGADPVDFHSIDGGFAGENYTLAEIEAAINAEAVMTGHSASASNWVLTMVSVELWEGGARTCYIDDINVSGTVYTLEPAQFAGNFRAKITE